MVKVSLMKCAGYSLPDLKEKMSEGLGRISFPLTSFRSMNIALKPNLLSAAGPESAVVTHPLFFQAAAEIILDHGGKPILVESPAVASLQNTLKATGYDAIIRHLGIETADSSQIGKISYPAAKRIRTFEVFKAVVDADMIVNLPKFKTHGLTYITASVKNLFGFIPGMRKSQMHIALPGKEEFSESILDLYGALVFGFDPPKALLHILDAVVALEGDGPGSGGKPRELNAIIIGRDALAVDWTAIQVSGLNARLSTILTLGLERGMGISSEQDIVVVGQKIEDMRVHNFVPPKGSGMTALLGVPFIQGLLKHLFTARPVPIGERCSLCYLCREICPAHAIEKAMPGHTVPRFDYEACIRCLCCMEVCPKDGISVKKGVLQRFIK